MVECNERPWGEALGEGADEVLADLQDEPDRGHARRALSALAEALGEDEALEVDPGLPADYRVLGRLGSGASGVVFRAYQESLGREVAVKVLHPGGDSREVERLLGEARRLATLVHPGIVTVHEVGRARTGVYVTLELQPGGSLQSLLTVAALNPARAARLTHQVADALVFTHAHGVVHLDLKPGNVLLDASGEARVADFGLAREVSGVELTSTSGGLIGTPAFMAPEQASDRRDQIGERTDVYGLGVLLYACLTGDPPFVRRSLVETLVAVQKEEPEPLTRVAPGTPRDLIAITCRAMAKEPSDRYPTARAFSQDLERFEAGLPVGARLPGRFQGLVRSLRRHSRELAIAGAGSLLAVLAMLPFFYLVDEDEGEAAWVEAAQEWVDAGEFRAASLLLERIDATSKAGGHRDPRLADLRRRLQEGDPVQAPVPEEVVAGEPTGLERELGIEPGDEAWIEGQLGEDWLDYPTRWLGSPLEVEKAWRELLSRLGEEWRRMEEPARERTLELCGAAPFWHWQEGFVGWLLERPAGPLELIEALGRVAPDGVSRSTYEVLVEVFVVTDAGASVKVASHHGSAGLGETLRFEGRADSGFALPREHIGADHLHLLRGRVGSLPSGHVAYEVEGDFRSLTGGVQWDVWDRETYLGISTPSGSWFLDTPGESLLVGGASLLGAHRFPQGSGEAVTIVMLAEAMELGAGHGVLEDLDRGLEDWSLRLADDVEFAWAVPLEPGFDEGIPPLRRAHMLGSVVSLAVLRTPEGQQVLNGVANRMASAGIDAASISDPFCDRGTYTRTTSAGADLAYWLSTGREPARGPEAALASSLGALPLPGSASPERAKGTMKAWLFGFYPLAGLALTIAALYESSTSARRRAYLGWALIIATQGVDKTAPLALGAFPWDPLALALMAVISLLLWRWAGGWAVGAAVSLGLAAGLEIVPALDQGVRLPVAVGLVCIAGVTARVAPWGWARWLPLGAILVIGAALLVSFGMPEDLRLLRGVYLVTLFMAFVVMLTLALAGSALLKGEDQRDKVRAT